jgi:hypothetical protein
MSKRPRGRPFAKGQSGNPGGQPKTPLTIEAQRIKADVKALAQEQGPEAIRQLSIIMQDEDAPHAARVSAATALLDRGYGRPSQTVDMTASISATVAQESARDIIAGKLAGIAQRLEEERAASQLN